MGSQTMISVKIDKDLKEAAQQTAKEFGLPLGTMINVWLRQVVRDKELTLSNSYKPTPYLEKIIEESEKELESGKSITYSSLDEMFKDLDG